MRGSQGGRGHGEAPGVGARAGRAGSGRALVLPVALLLAASSLLLLPEATMLPVAAVPATAAVPGDAAAIRRDAPGPAPPILPARLERLASDGNEPPDPFLGGVTGTLRDPAHAPICGAGAAGVAFVDRTGRRRLADAVAGAYALQPVAAGTYWVIASAAGYRSRAETIELRPGAPWTGMDFVLQPAVQLRIVVTAPDGRSLVDTLAAQGGPVAACRLVPVATREPPGRRWHGEGDGGGTFGAASFHQVEPAQYPAAGCIGILHLDDELPVWVSLVHNDRVLATQQVGRGQDEVTFVVSPDALLAELTTILARVVSAETGMAILGARMVLRGGDRSDPGVATDRHGLATIERCAPGRCDLQIGARGFETFRQAIDAPPGTTDLRTIALAPEVTVEGRVLGLGDLPQAASFSLGIVDAVEPSIQWLPHAEWSSRGDGTFVIRGLGRRQYAIRTSNHEARNEGEWQGVPWVSGNLLLDARGGSIAGLEIRLHPATKLVLHDATGGADGMRYRVVDERGFELAAGRSAGPAPRPLQVPAGLYRVARLDARGVPLAECRTTLGSQTVTVDLARLPSSK